MSLQTKPFEFAQEVKNTEDIATYLAIFLEENGIQGLIDGLKYLVNNNLNALTLNSDMNDQSLYRSLSQKGNPKIETLDKIVRTLGFKLTIAK